MGLSVSPAATLFVFGSRVLLPSLADALGNGNKVILSHIVSAITAIVSHVPDGVSLGVLIDGCCNAKGKEVREYGAAFIETILKVRWVHSVLSYTFVVMLTVDALWASGLVSHGHTIFFIDTLMRLLRT